MQGNILNKLLDFIERYVALIMNHFSRYIETQINPPKLLVHVRFSCFALVSSVHSFASILSDVVLNTDSSLFHFCNSSSKNKEISEETFEKPISTYIFHNTKVFKTNWNISAK